ncbi:MAG: hypothetical protein ACFFAS_18715 [Promethearchaeota archaeon]
MSYSHFAKIGDICKHLPLGETLKNEKPETYIESNAIIYVPIIFDNSGKVRALTKSPFKFVSAESQFGKELLEDFIEKWDNGKSL